MKIIFSDNAWEDYLYRQKSNRENLKKINELIKAIERDHYQGIGKPEPLKHGLSGYWSRRIDAQHRLVYRIEQDAILIAQARYHY